MLLSSHDLSDEEFTRLKQSYADDVNNLIARLEEDRKRWREKLKEKLKNISQINKDIELNHSNERLSVAGSVASLMDTVNYDNENRDAENVWLLEEEQLQVIVCQILVRQTNKFIINNLLRIH